MLLTAYACTVLTTRNRVYSRAVLATVSVLSVGLAVAAGFGFCLAIGLRFSLVVSSVAFVMLGLGVDDAFVVLNFLRMSDPNKPVLGRIQEALSRAGPSITLTSVTDFAAFAVGATTVIPALRAFCLFAAITILFDFFFQCTFFVAFVTFDEDRVERDGTDCTQCCLPCTTFTSDPKKKQCSDDKYDPQVATATLTFISKTLPNAILSTTGRILVIVTTIALLGVSCYGITQLELDFKYPHWFVPAGTTADHVLGLDDAYFTTGEIPASAYTGPVDYYVNQGQLPLLCDALGKNRYIESNTVNCWYTSWEEETGGAGSSATTKVQFYTALQQYANTTGLRFKDYLNFDATTGELASSEIPCIFDKLPNTQMQLDAMDSVRATVSDFAILDARVFSYPFLFFEGLAIIYEETIRNVLLTLVVVFLMSLLFLADFAAAAIVVATIALVDVCILGFIHFAGMHMNTVIAVNLILAIGLTVDYSAHIAHAYMHCEGTRAERARIALETIGISVFNGGMTTLVATMALAPAKTYVFQVFFKCFVLIIVFGLYFGMVVLPVALSFVGPSRSYASDKVVPKEKTPQQEITF